MIILYTTTSVLLIGSRQSCARAIKLDICLASSYFSSYHTPSDFHSMLMINPEDKHIVIFNNQFYLILFMSES